MTVYSDSVLYIDIPINFELIRDYSKSTLFKRQNEERFFFFNL